MVNTVRDAYRREKQVMGQRIEVLHAIPGRARIKINNRDENGVIVEAILRNMPGVKSASYSAITRTAVIHYEKKTSLREILQSIHSFSTQEVQTTPNKHNWLKDPKVRDVKIVLLSLVAEKMLASATPLGILALFRPTALATLYASRKTIINGFKSIFHPNEDTLTTSAMLASMLKGSPYSAFIIYIMSTVSELLNEYTIEQTRGYVKGMMEVGVRDAWLITEDGSEVKVLVDHIQKDDKVMIFQGNKIPFDGEVIKHHGEVDQSAITGEYLPVPVEAGAYVFAGTVVTEGKIAIRVAKVGEDLTVNRMIRLIEEAQEKEAGIQTSTENFTKKVIPLSFVLAGAIYLFTGDWNRVLNMLVIDYVCGVKLSTATAISATIGQSAQKGVLIKGGHILEKLATVNTLLLDKTGTITEGTPIVTKVHAREGFTEDEVLAYAASVEEHSTHPIASAILEEAARRGIEPLPHMDDTVENHVGKGVLVRIGEENVLAGSRSFLQSYGVEVNDDDTSGILIAKGEKLIGIIEIEDEIREGVVELIERLKNNHIDECIMVTGDHEQSAKKTALQTGIDSYIANAMPEEKAGLVRRLKEDKNRVVMMVGDGINDAPALAYSDVGVTLGAKMTDIAMETADVVIHAENPLLIADSIERSAKAMRVIKQNIIITLCINTGAIVLGTFGVIRPVVGAAIHNAATIGVVLNSAKLMLKGDD